MTQSEFNVIIVSAGSGSRLGGQVPKQYMNLSGKMVCQYALDLFHSFQNMKHCVLVVDRGHEHYYKPLLKLYPQLEICMGGDTRKDSVFNGIKCLDNKQLYQNVLIHDAARPFVEKQNVQVLLDALVTAPAATLSSRIVDTIRYASNNNIAGNMVDRKSIQAIQTPQGFHFECIKNAHIWAGQQVGQEFTDDTSIVSAFGANVQLIEGTNTNFKITTSEDWERAKKMVSQDFETRIGQGVDVHSFDDVEAEFVTLCGVRIPHERKLKGHSDADVGLHTLTDAIYGALGAGDIGTHFPPSDMTFKDMDSAVFLEHAMDLVRAKGGKLINADVTLICEAPKIGPYRDQIIARMADIMKISPERLNIKATTTEKLGFTGRSEGIAAQAVVSIALPALNEE